MYKEFIRLLHGSYKSREDIINEFVDKNSDFVKSHLKKKVKEISTKDKVGEEKIKKFLVYKTYFEKLEFEEDAYENILAEKKEVYTKE